MKKWITLVLGLALTLCLTVTAWADYDYIDRYAVEVTPSTEDGSLTITAALTWTALEKLPHGQELKIGIPNGSIREETALTDNIERLAYDNSYMYVYLDSAYDAGESFTFSYRWVQEYMYTLDGSTVSYDYTPGWFDKAKIGEMTLTWHDPAGVTGDFGNTSNAAGDVTVTDTGMIMTGWDMDYGQTMNAVVQYASWPTVLDQAYSADNMPADYNGGYYDDYDDDFGYDDGSFLVVLAVFVVIVFLVILWAGSRDGYRGGFGTHYVFVNHLWYPAGPDGRPRPGSVGTPHRPKPPTNNRGGGFGGGSRGGGFGGGGFGGGGHCACASSCACACACACAGGGRAGCSAKNLYGAVKLSREVTEKLQ